MSWVPLDRWAEVEEWNAEITCSIQKDTFIDDAAPGTTSTSLRSNYQATVVLRGVLASWSGEGTCSGTWLEKTVTQGPGDQVGTADVDGSGSGPASAFLNLGIDLVTGKGEYDLRCSRLTFPVNVVTETTTAGHTDTVASIGERTIYVPEIRNQPLPESGLVLAGEREIETELGTAMLSWNLTPAPPVLTTCYVEITDHAGTPLAGLQTVNVGERVQLKVRVILPLGATIDSVQWTIPGTIIKDYVITPTTAQVQTIIPADLQQESITFYWVDGATGHIVEAKAIVNGLTCTASVTFDVNRPSVLLFRAAIRHVITIGFPPAPPPPPPPPPLRLELFFGMEWEAAVQAGPGEAGEIAFTQLIKSERRVTTNTGTDLQSPPMIDFELDGAGLASKPIGNNQTILNDHNDFPGLKIDGVNDPTLGFVPLVAASVLDGFELYLMYRPAGAGSIWVPLSKLLWGWCALAQFLAGVWTLDPNHKGNPKASSPTTDFPVWTKVIDRAAPWQAGSAPASCPAAAQPWE